MDFQERFSDEAACLDYLAASRWPDGYRCPACGGERDYRASGAEIVASCFSGVEVP